MLNQDFLEKYLITFDYLDGIVLTDRDSVEIFSAYKLNKKATL